MKLQRHSTEEPTVDLTSLIDVVFLLLLFFMVSTTFEHQALLKVDLPEASASALEDRPEVPDSLELVIDSEGRMFLNDQRLVDSDERTLRAAIEQAVGEERTLPLVLRADRLTPHHFVVTAMDVAAQMGFSNLSIATDRTAGTGQ
jgi:biopolymer transport protein ExbD